MAESVTASISSKTSVKFQNVTSFGTTYTGTPSLDFERSFNTTETTKSYSHRYSVTSTPTVVDLTSLTDDYGTALSFSTVRHIHIRHTDTTNSLTVGGGTTPVFAVLPVLTSYTASVGDNGSCVSITTNITVDSTHKLLSLTASAGTISVDVFIVGA